MTAALILAGLVVLWAGSETLVKGAKGLALGFGVGPLTVGLTVVAVATSTPELVVSLEAALGGSAAIALGNVIGSNVSNVLLVLAVSALVRPLTVRAEVLRRELPVMLGVTLALGAALADGVVARWEGAALLAGAGGYLVAVYRLGRRDRRGGVAAEFAGAVAEPVRPLWLNVTWGAAGLGLLALGASLLLRGVMTLAQRLGVSEIVIGLTVVAVGTSLPELAASVVAAARREGDIVFGNVIGSNVLNILLVLGLTALVSPVSAQGVRGADLFALGGSAALLLPLARRGRQLDRVGGAVLLLAYGLYLFTMPR